MSKRRYGDSGAAAVEFALILPLLMILVFGIIEFGLGWYQSESANAGAREAARRAAVGQVTSCTSGSGMSDLKGIVVGTAGGVALGATNMTKDDGNANGTFGDAGDTVTVTVHYTVDLSILGGLIPGITSQTTTAVAQARIEAQGGQVSC